MKIGKNIGILHRIAQLLPEPFKLNVYYALVYPWSV